MYTMLKVGLRKLLKLNENECLHEPFSSATIKDWGNIWLHSQVKIP